MLCFHKSNSKHSSTTSKRRKLLLQDPWKWVLYLSYVMDVPTPTTDCLNLVYDLLEPPVITRKNSNASLIASGTIEDLRPASVHAPALKPAKITFCHCFQAATDKRATRYLSDTDR
ncbi:hypothetical protein MTR_5g016640 [Medicago truncatula]|uniref:Uncharacterized protein n=1 Tax=Medicago truncatula TaxID=3880 RepID=G7K5A0_MEDTR|nr:hypothetical protein MTR_5g016640 [Medicago truncatula]